LRRIHRHLNRRHHSADTAHAQLFRVFDVVRAFRPPTFLSVLLLLASVLLASCRGPVRPYEPLLPQVANLRLQFNQDVGTVRILILPAPT